MTNKSKQPISHTQELRYIATADGHFIDLRNKTTSDGNLSDPQSTATSDEDLSEIQDTTTSNRNFREMKSPHVVALDFNDVKSLHLVGLDFSNIESLHLVDLDRYFGLNLFPCPKERIYPVEEYNGVTRYLQPWTTLQTYGYFKAVKKTRLRAQLRKRFGLSIANRVMHRYLAFEYEFQAYCWGNRYVHIENREKANKAFWLRDLIDISLYFTTKSACCIEQPESVLNADINFMKQNLIWYEGHSEALSKRKETAILQWNYFAWLATQYPTNWEYYDERGGLLDLIGWDFSDVDLQSCHLVLPFFGLSRTASL